MLCLQYVCNVRAYCYLPSRHYLWTDYVSDVRQMSLLSSVTHCFCHLWKQFLNYTCAHARKTLIKNSCVTKHKKIINNNLREILWIHRILVHKRGKWNTFNWMRALGNVSEVTLDQEMDKLQNSLWQSKTIYINLWII